jgi:class 3 adenylate cyclase/tetratricopeptide (TPR) repeat protein
MASPSVAGFTSFIPHLVVERCRRHPEPLSEALIDARQGTALFLDISGFTKLAESMGRGSSKGVENLTALLNEHLEHWLETIADHGGSVVSFAGDAFLAVWPKSEQQTTTQVTHQIIHCAVELQKVHRQKEKSSVHSPIKFRIGIGSGPFELLHVGGRDEQWLTMVRGPALTGAIEAESFAQAGQVSVAPETWQHAPEGSEAKVLPSGHAIVEHTTPLGTLQRQEQGLLDSTMRKTLWGYVPPVIRQRVSAGQRNWLTELRVLTVLFVNVPGLGGAAPLRGIQNIVSILQNYILKYKGTINKLSVDDKGVSMLAVFGLPPLAHEDDPARGVMAALEIHRAFEKEMLEGSFGITTGQAYCGIVGAKLRREYTVIGDVVNLAARLMQAASGSVLCDSPTGLYPMTHVDFGVGREIKVKGKSEAIEVYEPKLSELFQEAAPSPGASMPIVGRDTLLESLNTTFEGWKSQTSEEPTEPVVISANAGLGRSVLAAHCFDRISSLYPETFLLSVESLNETNPHRFWQNLFSQCFNFSFSSEKEFTEALIRAVDKYSYGDRLPLLNTYLRLGLAETSATRGLEEERRVGASHQLMTDLFRARFADKEFVWIIDDGHRFDAESMDVCVYLNQNLPLLKMVLTLREDGQKHLSEGARRFLATATRFGLEPLGLDMCQELAVRHLGVETVDEQFADKLYLHSDGNPHYCREYLRLLDAADHLQITTSHCRLNPRSDWSDISIPPSISGLITSQIDTLPATEQLVVKVASVIGPTFTYRVLYHVYPVEHERASIKACLLSLREKGWLERVSAQGGGEYKFTQHVVYESSQALLLFEQRRELHLAVARWYVPEEEGREALDAALGAEHFAQANEFGEALNCFREAVEQANDATLYGDVITLVGKAKACLLQSGSRLSRRARRQHQIGWARHLADAFFGLGKMRASKKHAMVALALGGIRAPSNRLEASLKMFGWRISRLVTALLGPISKESSRRPRLVHASFAARRLMEIYLQQNQRKLLPSQMLLTHMLAEKLGAGSEMARLLIVIAKAAHSQGQLDMAKSHLKTAIEGAQDVQDMEALILANEVRTSLAFCEGRWKKASSILSRSEEWIWEYGDRETRDQALLQKSHLLYFSGLPQDSQDAGEKLGRLAQQRGNDFFSFWSKIILARARVSRGHYTEAFVALKTDYPHLRRTQDPNIKFTYLALMALAALKTQHPKEAFDLCLLSVSYAKGINPYQLLAADGYAHLLECLAGYSSDSDYTKGLNRRRYSNLTQSVLQHFKTSTRYVRAARPLYYHHLGLLHQSRGKNTAAWGHFHKSLRLNQSTQMPFIEGRAHFKLGECPKFSGRKRMEHFSSAATIFHKGGYELWETETQKRISVLRADM